MMKWIAVLALVFLVSCAAPLTPGQKASRVKALETELASPANPNDGIGLIIALDCSPSMNDNVRDASGNPAAKIEIAKRCLSSLVTKAEAFAKEHPEKRFLVGVSVFSSWDDMLLGMQPPSSAVLAKILPKISSGSGTAIGNAIASAKKHLNAANFVKSHILVITDGENNAGDEPDIVTKAIMSGERPTAVYLIGFDVAAQVFDGVKEAGATVLSANDEAQLQGALDYLLAGKILAEKTE